MDSVKSFKGYGKVNEAEEREFKQKTRRRLLIIVISAIVLTTVIIGSVVGALVHKSNNKSSSKESTQAVSQASTVKAVCSVTLYPDTCIKSLSTNNTNGSNKTDPEQLFKMSMEVAVSELVYLSALPDKLIKLSNNTRVKAALEICKDLFTDSIDELRSSISSMEVSSDGKQLSNFKIDDIKTWISTAVTNQETCLDSLDESDKADVFRQVKTAMQNSTEYTSNSLAIVSKIISLLDDLDIPIHRRRKLLSESKFPRWLGRRERRLLQEVMPTPDITVAGDGSGDFKTIKEAVESIGKKNKTRTVVYVKEGKYVENVVVDKAHWNIMMYGDGSGKTVVSGSMNFIDGTPTFSTATFIAAGKGFIAKDMGFENTAGPDKHQAVAFRSGSDESVFYRCSFDAYQDTLYAHSNRQFYRDCDITGTIDFIFGNAAVVFQNCNIQPRQPMPNQFVTITAQGKKDPNQNTGISIHRSTISPRGTVTAKTYLGRPWKDFSTTIIMETEIGAVVNPIGWIEWVYNVTPPATIFYGEYRNTGPGASVDKRVTWPGYKSVVPEDVAAQYTVESFIQGTQWLPQASVTFDASL